MRLLGSKNTLTALLFLLLVGSAAAESGSDAQGWGRPPAATTLAALPPVNLGRINPTFRFDNASVAVGAVGLRNRGAGGISVSDVFTPMKRAFAYWAVITNGPPTAAAANISMKRGVASGPFTNIAGTAIGSGPNFACWRGDRVTVFRGAIPLSLATGNGLYLVLLRPGANGSRAGESPWEASDPPLFEGVSIVLIGSGNSTVTVYDRGFAGEMFFGDLIYRLNSPVSVANAREVVFHNIGGDGQTRGVGERDIAATAGEVTTLNGRRIAGPGSPAGSSDWNGNVAAPFPQLWDTTRHEVTAAARAGSTPTILPFTISAPDDCLITVANVLSVEGG